MVFSSTVFLFVFLPILLCVYFVVKKEYKNYILLLFSLIFYAWGEAKYLYVLIMIIAINYCFAICIDKYRTMSRKLVILDIAVNLTFLFIFKYLLFIISNLNLLPGVNITKPNITLPLGISFFTFQAMSYSIDVYRRKANVQYNFWDLALYVSFFPQLIAGPIVKYNSIELQLKNRKETFEKFEGGVKRFIVGLGKKVLLADMCAIIVRNIFEYEKAGVNSVSALTAWLGVLSYSFQIYYDFSGYSDMAVGLGKMFGFDFQDNFSYPYASCSIQEYWRRWHISLGEWFREYVYFPVVTSKVNIRINKYIKKHFGGKASRKMSVCIPLFVTWFLTGIWHGACWNYVGWGIYFAIIIIVENLGVGKMIAKWPRIVQHLYVWFIVFIARAMVKMPNIGAFFRYIRCLFGINGNKFADMRSLVYLDEQKILLIICALFCFPIIPYFSNRLKHRWKGSMENVVYMFIFLVSLAHMIANTYTPFIYFNF